MKPWLPKSAYRPSLVKDLRERLRKRVRKKAKGAKASLKGAVKESDSQKRLEEDRRLADLPAKVNASLLTITTAFRSSEYLLKNSTILDSGATIHVCNQISRFNNFRIVAGEQHL
ncbi:hypothetical protein MFIFM68171_05805 [Madurella fahalii]|uniref:Uncharacterized protein n=1 Tax=Madurella fahalii TaxID=1157608 RepID=A0ABQ0GD28_9PEZI